MPAVLHGAAAAAGRGPKPGIAVLLPIRTLLVSVREDVESVESPVIPWGGAMQEAADVDASEPPPLRPRQAALSE